MKEKWILFSYSVPAANAKARMRVWRRISASGAVQLKTGLQVLPNREDLLESITWLIGEVQALGGEALAIRCARIEGMTDDRIETLFQGQVDPQFLQIQTEATLLKETAPSPGDETAKEALLALRKLRKRCEALQHLDFFPSGMAGKTLAVLDAVAEKLRSGGSEGAEKFPAVLFDRAAYQNRTWVTRARPYIDRLSSAWLISRFIDARARFDFLEPGEQPQVDRGEVPFDMAGVGFSHQGELITFEVMARGFALLDPGVRRIGELVRCIDIQENATLPDDAGLLKKLLDGLVVISTKDHELLDRALLVFDALYAGYSLKK